MSNIGMKILNDTRLKRHYCNEHISDDDSTKNINNLNIVIKDEKLYITWDDCSDIHWKSNVLVKSKNYIPTDVFSENVLDAMYTKNMHSVSPYVDSDVEINTLYCYRVFTQFDNLDEYYSGFKNIMFIYFYDKDIEINKNDVIDANMILVDEEHRFITEQQIFTLNNHDIILNDTTVDGGIF